MKKKLVLVTLFVMPILAYLFFATGVNNFDLLGTQVKEIPELQGFKKLDGTPVQLTDRITVLGFTGTQPLDLQAGFFHLNQKVYERYHQFEGFQILYLAPVGTEGQVALLKDKFKGLTDFDRWYFAFGTPEQIQQVYHTLARQEPLGTNLDNHKIILIDKKRNVRGRVGDDYLDGYDIDSPAAIQNEFMDDFKILLYEYKAALKRNAKREI